MELEIFFNLGAILFRVASTKRGIISDRAMWRTFSLLSVHPSDRVAAKLFDHSQNYKNNLPTFSFPNQYEGFKTSLDQWEKLSPLDTVFKPLKINSSPN